MIKSSQLGWKHPRRNIRILFGGVLIIGARGTRYDITRWRQVRERGRATCRVHYLNLRKPEGRGTGKEKARWRRRNYRQRVLMDPPGNILPVLAVPHVPTLCSDKTIKINRPSCYRIYPDRLKIFRLPLFSNCSANPLFLRQLFAEEGRALATVTTVCQFFCFLFFLKFWEIIENGLDRKNLFTKFCDQRGRGTASFEEN